MDKLKFSSIELKDSSTGESKTIDLVPVEPTETNLGGISGTEKEILKVASEYSNKVNFIASTSNPNYMKLKREDNNIDFVTVDGSLTKANYAADAYKTGLIYDDAKSIADNVKTIDTNIIHLRNSIEMLLKGEDKLSLSDIHRIVQMGAAKDYFSIGDQINITWTDITNNSTYDVPMDIVHMDYVRLVNGNIVPGMYLQWHYTLPFTMQFDQTEAFYIAKTSLPAGIYNITVGDDWGTYCKKGDQYQFTLANPVPQNGMLVGFSKMFNTPSNQWTVSTFANSSMIKSIETVSVVSGSSGTSLGTLTLKGSEDGRLNSIQKLAYGNNRWSQSSLRQFLNSNKAIGEWWSPQNDFDMCPNNLFTKAGFMSGFDDEFLSCIKPIKVTTAMNTLTDVNFGDVDTTFDTFFIPALEQMNIEPQLSCEGSTWDYWKKTSGLHDKMLRLYTYPQIKIMDINDNSTAIGTRLRSTGRGNAYSTWYINKSGYINHTYANALLGISPTCVIC